MRQAADRERDESNAEAASSRQPEDEQIPARDVVEPSLQTGRADEQTYRTAEEQTGRADESGGAEEMSQETVGAEERTDRPEEEIVKPFATLEGAGARENVAGRPEGVRRRRRRRRGRRAEPAATPPATETTSDSAPAGSDKTPEDGV